jgi:hypothetical protein
LIHRVTLLEAFTGLTAFVTTPKKKRNYLNNKEFLDCIVEYRGRVHAARQEGRSAPPMPRYAGECIVLICSRMSTRPNFSGYSYREDMVSDAVLDCVKAFDNFDPEKSTNPFGYFSRIGWRAMIRRIYDERVETYIKHKNYQRRYSLNEHYEAPEGWTDSNARSGTKTEVAETGRTISDDVVGKFEAALAKKKLEKERKAQEALLSLQGTEEDDEPVETQLGFSRVSTNISKF